MSRERSGAIAKGGEVVAAPGRRLAGALVLLMAIPALTTTASAAEVVATLVFDPAQLTFEEHEGYDLVSIAGADFTTDPTKPMLPALDVQLLLPPGTDCGQLTTTLSSSVAIPGGFDIVPAPRPVRLSSDQAVEVPQPNTDAYSSELPYPCEVARLAGAGNMGGYRVATIRVTPLRYVAAEKMLLLHTRVRVELDAVPSGDRVGDPTDVLCPTSSMTRVVRAMVANPEVVDLYPARHSSGSRAEGPEYIVVCPETLAASFEPLAAWKTAKGVRAEVVTLESIDSNPVYAGVDQAERIRNCIRAHRELYGTSWVLLGGDTNLVPPRLAFDFFYDQGLPSDLYYADLDGTWDGDGDGKWGEVDEDNIDMYSDLFVGRAPVTCPQEAVGFVEKALTYEGATEGFASDFQLCMLFLGEIMWDDPDPYTDGGVALDMIEDESVPARFEPITKLYERDGTLWSGSVLGELNGGHNIVVHEGHANIAKACVGPDDLTLSSIDGLTNGGRGGLWYSVGCWSAAIDHDTFGEHWLTNTNGGGVAYVGNSRYGWGCPGYPGQCVSDLYGREFFSSLFVRDLNRAGVAHADAKHQFVGAAMTDDYMRYAMYELNLLGDPEMPVWTDAPSVLTVTHASGVDASGGTASLSVEVTDGGLPVEGATVCVMSENLWIYEVAETGADGVAGVAFESGEEDEVLVTVTARNSIPYRGSAVLEGSWAGIDDDADDPILTALPQNYPNPFGRSTTVTFSLSAPAPVTLGVYDVSGRRVAVLLDEVADQALSSVSWDGRDGSGRELASGIYFARLTVGGEHFEKRMTLLR